jgi:ribosomal protein S18 acetylase RimI-like enzyme
MVDHKCSMCTTYDLPLDENLMDDRGETPDISSTSHMVGVSISLEDRHAYGFYTDEGETARIVSEGSRKQGMLVALSSEDMSEAAGCLVRFLAASKKKWAVFSVDMGRYVRQFDPTTMWRLVLGSPRAYDHSVAPLSKDNRKQVLRMFSEYYDQGSLQASVRLRSMVSDKSYSVFALEGGFVVTKLEGETGLIYDIYVTPGHQGRGLGEELMRCALTSLSGRATSVYLHTSYPRAKALYEKFGFKVSYSQLSIRLDELALMPPSS